MSSTYFWKGFQHAAFAGLCVAGFYKLCPYLPYKQPLFWLGTTFGSSALFFIPSHIAKHNSLKDWLYQFLHYPLPDWDILIFSMDWHRFIVTHSALLPALLLLNKRFFLQPTESLIIGLALGIATHLFWDGISGSLATPIVVIPYVFSLERYLAKAWLIANALILFLILYSQKV